MTKKRGHTVSTQLITTDTPIIDAVMKITEAVRTASDLQAFFYSIHGIIGQLMPVKNFFIALYEKEDNGSEFIRFPFFIDEFDPPPQGRFPLRKTLTGYVLRRGEPLLLDEKNQKKLRDDGEIDAALGTDSAIWLGVPLQTRDQVIGAVVVQSYDHREEYGEKERQILSFVSDQIAVAIELTRYREKLEEVVRIRTRELEEEKRIQTILFDISQAVYNANGLRDFLQSVQGLIGQLMDARNFYIALYDTEIDKYRFPYFADEFDQSESLLPEDLSCTLTDYVRCHGPLLADREVHDRLIAAGEVEGIVGTDSLIWLGVPLLVPGKNQAIGVMTLQSYDDQKKYGEKEKRILMNISTTIALAIDRINLITDLFHHFNNAVTSIRGNAEILLQSSHRESEWITRLHDFLQNHTLPVETTGDKQIQIEIHSIVSFLTQSRENTDVRIGKIIEGIEEAARRMNRVFKPLLQSYPQTSPGLLP